MAVSRERAVGMACVGGFGVLYLVVTDVAGGLPFAVVFAGLAAAGVARLLDAARPYRASLGLTAIAAGVAAAVGVTMTGSLLAWATAGVAVVAGAALAADYRQEDWRRD